MRTWLAGEYQGVVFENDHGIVGYALFRTNSTEIYLRQFFIVRHLRRKGYGRRALHLLRQEFPPKEKRLLVDVLVSNAPAIEFWRAVGFSDYALTLEKMPESAD